MNEKQSIKQYGEDKRRLAKRFSFMDPKSGALRFGYGCPRYNPRNWFNLVWNLCEKIENELKKDPEAKKSFLVLEVKEKFGRLCFYSQGATTSIKGLITEAETKSQEMTEKEDLRREICKIFKYLNVRWELLENAESDLNDILENYEIRRID